MKDMETCVKHQVPIIITSLRPPNEIVDAAHSYGGVVFHDVINVKHARKAAEHGVDGLILVCAGAGGHAGALSPFALLRKLKHFFNGTVPLSGAISDGWGIASALALGADLAYMGTRFIATAEANAPAYKEALTRQAARGYRLFQPVHRRARKLPCSSVAAAGLDPDNLPQGDKSEMNFGSGGNTKQKAWRDIWGSGQGIGQIGDAPTVAELVERLRYEFVGEVVWGSPAFAAGIARDTTVVAVDGEAYSAKRLQRAVAAAQSSPRPIELLLRQGERYRTARIDYRDGPRAPHLERIAGRPDVLTDILSARK